MENLLELYTPRKPVAVIGGVYDVRRENTPSGQVIFFSAPDGQEDGEFSQRYKVPFGSLLEVGSRELKLVRPKNNGSGLRVLKDSDGTVFDLQDCVGNSVTVRRVRGRVYNVIERLVSFVLD